jgi:hypothetical protein
VDVEDEAAAVITIEVVEVVEAVAAANPGRPAASGTDHRNTTSTTDSASCPTATPRNTVKNTELPIDCLLLLSHSLSRKLVSHDLTVNERNA